MAPQKRVSGDAVVDLLADLTRQAEKPYATTTDIAEGLGVTPQTVRNNASEIADDPRINKGKVGQSSVYWLADPSERNGREAEEPGAPGNPPGRSPPEDQEQTSGDGARPRDEDEDESGFLKGIMPSFEMVVVRVAALSSLLAVIGFFNTVATVLGSPLFGPTLTLWLFVPAVYFAAAVCGLVLLGWGVSADVSFSSPDSERWLGVWS
jgi:hypothetical protein